MSLRQLQPTPPKHSIQSRSRHDPSRLKSATPGGHQQRALLGHLQPQELCTKHQTHEDLHLALDSFWSSRARKALDDIRPKASSSGEGKQPAGGAGGALAANAWSRDLYLRGQASPDPETKKASSPPLERRPISEALPAEMGPGAHCPGAV